MKQRKKSTRKFPVKGTILTGIIIIVVLSLTFSRVFRSCRGVPHRKAEITSEAQNEIHFRKDSELLITGADGAMKVRLDVERAETADKQAMGLMFRKEMGEQEGMLFVFDDIAIRDFWMKNTILSLDMLFISEKMEIITIHEKTTPLTEDEYSSSAPAKYVVEVNAGFCSKFGIAKGDRIRLL